MEQSYNARCPAVKRLLREAKELNEATEEYYAVPLEDNLFEWHFTVRGPPQTEFDGGIYHGRIIMPAEYPMKPPNIIFLTPNGRFETNKKICLSISGHHPETWQPSWSIRTALLAIIGFMPTPAIGTIGSLDYTAAERAALAKKSLDFKCSECDCVSKLLKERTSDNEELQKEAREVMSQVAVTSKSENGANPSDPSNNEEPKETNVEDNTNAKAESTATTDNNTTNNNSDTDTQEVLMEGSITNIPTRISPDSSSNPNDSSSFVNNLILSAAIFVFVALLMRRLFLLEGDPNDDLEDIIM